MADNKTPLTDAEIKKALEEWGKEIKDDYKRLILLDAPMDCFEESHTEKFLVLSNALDLIKHLEADKEALIAEQETLQKALAEKNAEIEKLKNDCFGLSIQCIAMKDCIVTVAEEAVQEFAERLCEGRVSNDPVVIAVKVELKEMAGESK